MTPTFEHARAVKKFYSDKTIQWFLENYMVKHISYKSTINKVRECGESPWSILVQKRWGRILFDNYALSSIINGIVLDSGYNSSNYVLRDPETDIFIAMSNSNWSPYLRLYVILGFITAHVTFKYYSIPNIFYKDIFFTSPKAVMLQRGEEVLEIVEGILGRSMVWFTSEYVANFYGCKSTITMKILKQHLRNKGTYRIPVELYFRNPTQVDLEDVCELESPSIYKIHFYEDEAMNYRRQVFERKMDSEIKKLNKFREETQKKIEKLKEMEQLAVFFDAEIIAQLDMKFEDIYPTTEII